MKDALTDARETTDAFLATYADCLHQQGCGDTEGDTAVIALDTAIREASRFENADAPACRTAATLITQGLRAQRTTLVQMTSATGDADRLAPLPARMDAATDRVLTGLDAFIAGC